jgi:hypothetical protein
MNFRFGILYQEKSGDPAGEAASCCDFHVGKTDLRFNQGDQTGRIFAYCEIVCFLVTEIAKILAIFFLAN